ncbi:MAG: hypothetical protein FJ280_06880 [Planctomycetes bacterium]|nr:hypothetical protein [Planctomycetota bacterium]
MIRQEAKFEAAPRGNSKFQAPNPKEIPSTKHQIPNKSKIQSTKVQNAVAVRRSRLGFWVFFRFEFV